MTNAIESGPGGKAPPRREETAGHYVIASVPRAGRDRTAGETVDALLAHAHDCVDIVCVLDADEHLVGVIPLAGLLALPRDARLGQSVHAGFPRVHADTDQEKVASLALHHALSAIPVVDGSGRLLGVVPPVDLLHILR